MLRLDLIPPATELSVGINDNRARARLSRLGLVGVAIFSLIALWSIL